jgi:hypothetical protein
VSIVKGRTALSVVHSLHLHIGRLQGEEGCNPSGIRHSYNANYRLMLLNHAEKTSNCSAERKFRALKGNIKSCR